MSSARVFALAVVLSGIGACSLPTNVIPPSNTMDAHRLDGGPDAPPSDAGIDASDAGLDGGSDAGMDGGMDGGTDGGTDGGSDGGHDAWTPSPLGTACSAALTCASGFCVDGVCCESACSGVCETCNATGTCTASAAASDPDDECATQAASTCGTTGTCDGARACALYGTSTVCLGATCTAGVQTNARTCDGAGHCPGRGTTDCAPFACNGNVCFGSCSTSLDCGPTQYCDVPTSTCVPRQGTGVNCTANEQCTSTHCVDSVCCGSACTGLCQACSAALTGGASGTCLPATNGTDPDSECATQAASTCGTSGSCNGAGACSLYASGFQCRAPSCTGGTETHAATCNGTGTCSVPTTAPCTPFVCGASACLTSCTLNSDCTGGLVCSGGACLLAPGTACTSDGQCGTNHCVDGVCCNSACVGTCVACTAALRGSGSNGTCGPIAASSDPENECATQSMSSCGTTGSCSGAGACALYPSSTQCVAPSCTSGTETRAANCNGAGSCNAPTMAACTPFVCGASACLTSCTLNSDCTGGLVCSGGACLLAQGTACTGDAQCGTGHCVDSVCCNTACMGTCSACTAALKGSGSNGTCGSIAANTDPESECATQASTTCGTTGFCSGGGACALYDTTTVCQAQSCAAHVETFAQHCDGAGTCTPPSPATLDCSPYPCSGASCAMSCSTPADCLPGFGCAAGGTCSNANGARCTSSTQCGSGFCTDGFCCNLDCGGTCQACAASLTGGTDGMCSNVTDGTDPDGDCLLGLTCNAGLCL